MSKAKNIPVVDFGVQPTYVDDLCQIDELGPTTQLTFAVTTRQTHKEELERVVAVRLIIPTALRMTIGKQLLAGGEIHAGSPEDTDHDRLH